MIGKMWYKSKTVWTNVLIIGIAVMTLLAARIAEFEWVDWKTTILCLMTGIIVPLMNLALRAITKEPINFSQ